VAKYLPEITIDIKYFDGVQHVLLNGEDLGDKIREPEISMYASAVSAVGEVRAFLLETQRNIAKNNHVIMDGRDIGTVILPNAQVKVFLTASNEARAMRRFNELKAKGIEADYKDVLAELIERDTADSSRDIAPCVPADDAIFFDNSDYTFEQSVDKIIEIVNDICKGELS
jgi:cytidylate kinase